MFQGRTARTVPRQSPIALVLRSSVLRPNDILFKSVLTRLRINVRRYTEVCVCFFIFLFFSLCFVLLFGECRAFFFFAFILELIYIFEWRTVGQGDER